MKKKFSTCFTALAVACSALFGCSASGYTVFSPTAAFSDDILFSAKIMSGRAEYAYERMVEVISDIDSQVSLTDPNSDLSRFNSAAAGEPIEVGEHCFELFKLAMEAYELTDGAFNPAAGPLVSLWNLDPEHIAEYRPDADGTHISPELPSPESVAEALSYCDPDLVVASDNRTLTKLDDRVRLDFGGIAKGYATDKCKEVLDEYNVSSALIDISGNAYFYGDHISNGGGENGNWNVGVASPRPRGASRDYVCAVTIPGNTAAVTSGDYMRYYVHDGASGPVYITHIIGSGGVPIGVTYDGEWKNSDEWVISATVLGASGALCDALSTAVAVKGVEDGAALLEKVGVKGLIFTEKRFTIIGDIELYKPDVYSGFTAYGHYEL